MVFTAARIYREDNAQILWDDDIDANDAEKLHETNFSSDTESMGSQEVAFRLFNFVL